jgi:hypothetical protein
MYLREMRRAFVSVLLLLAACAPASHPTSSPAPTAANDKQQANDASEDDIKPGPSQSVELAPPPPEEIPNACAPKVEGVCVPDPAFVKRFCNGSYPDVALVLLAKDSPFTRMYLGREVDGWNAEGGASARARLSFDEEVLVLRRRAAPANGIVVGAGAGYLVMRWDGNCYTLEENELTAKRPPTPKHGPIPWRFYSDKTKDALLKNGKVLTAFQRRGKECKGATSGEVSRGCEAADAALSSAVVTEIRGGTSIPPPERRP